MSVRAMARVVYSGAVICGLALVAPAGRAEDGHEAAKGHDCCHKEAPRPAAAPAGGSSAAGYARSERTYAVPDVTLVDEAARPVPLRALLAADEPVMLNFIFTTCTAICPVMSRIFAKVPAELGHASDRVRFVSVSIDPEQDTPKRLAEYARRFGAGPRWRFLTGTVADVVAVERAFDAFRGDKMNHEPLTLLRAGPGQPWVRIDGFASPAELAREYEKAVGEVALR
jgi:protein SCO1/2